MSVAVTRNTSPSLDPDRTNARGAPSSLDEGRALGDTDRANVLESELRSLARRDPEGFRQALRQSLGDKADLATLERLLADIESGDLPAPNVEFVDAGTLGGGADGAYSGESGGTIYLDRRLTGDAAPASSTGPISPSA